MPKVVRIIALIMAILMGLSAIGMIAMYVAAETNDGASSSLAALEADLVYFDADPVEIAVLNDIV
ncbi:MAG: hypothetical protein IJY97_00045 [Clostridia bacterium]|nr:hypothetical protein [Clostridia bacterium]